MNTSRAQIVATIGPASGSLEILKELISHQMDLVRLNFSWGTYEEHASYIANVRQAAQSAGKNIPIIQDLSGPRVQSKDGHHFDADSGSILTEKDLRDLEFGLGQKVEYVCMSYVGSAQDIEELRSEMDKRQRSAKVIAKIERQTAVDNMDAIISAADAIMIGRGDMGNEVPIERIPFIEKNIIDACKKAGKPVIVATQMLVSMVENPEPTRAEVTDIAYAILMGADAVMLSEETARGRFPIQAVTIMEKVVLESERHLSGLELHLL